MYCEILSCRTHIELKQERHESYITFMVRPQNEHSFKINDKKYSKEDFCVNFDDESKPLRAYVNVFQNDFMNVNRREQWNLEENVLGNVTLLEYGDDKVKSIFYQIYVSNEIFERINHECYLKMPKNMVLSVEHLNGEYFIDDWEKDENSRYPKLNIVEFHFYNDLK